MCAKENSNIEIKIKKAVSDLKKRHYDWEHVKKNYPVLIHNSFSGLDLQGVCLKECNLNGKNIGNADLSNALLCSSKLRLCNFTGATLVNSDLSDSDLTGAIFKDADLSRAIFKRVNLTGARFDNVNLERASFADANLRNAVFTNCNMIQVNLSDSNLSGSHIVQCNLHAARLEGSRLIKTTISSSNLSECRLYGASVWDVILTDTIQDSIVITRSDDSVVTTDSIEIGHFIYLLINNSKIRSIIDSITSKVVLILGRFTDDRKPVLDSIKVELRKRNYIPIIFDFDGPENRNLTETVNTLAHMARFIIADISDAKCIPQELYAIVPHLPSVPVLPLLQSSLQQYAMFEHFKKYPWVLETQKYENSAEIISTIEDRIINLVESYLAKSTTSGMI